MKNLTVAMVLLLAGGSQACKSHDSSKPNYASAGQDGSSTTKDGSTGVNSDGSGATDVGASDTSASDAAADAQVATPSFPLKVSPNRRYLVGSNEAPFLMVGDVAWFLVTNLNKTDTLTYLEDRRAKGYNTILTEAIVNKEYTWDPPNNREGNAPFKTAGDFSTPNEAYFQHLDWVLARAEEKGLLVLLMACYLGFGSDYSDGWGHEIVTNGPTKNRNYGRFLANRYKSNKNIIWVHGGDHNPPKDSAAANNALEILKGIKDVIPSSLHSFHAARGTNAFDEPTFAPHLNVNATYSGDLTYVEALRAYGDPSFGPHFLFEGRYEGKQTWSEGKVNPPELVRAGAYWSQLSGSTGQISGVMPVWTFGYKSNPPDDNDWRKALNADTSYAMGHLRRFFEARAWQELVPDQGNATVTR
jgi:hypothetical protein